MTGAAAHDATPTARAPADRARNATKLRGIPA
jgi:hypothetical protein